MNEPLELSGMSPEELGLLTAEQLVQQVVQLQGQLSVAREQMELQKVTDLLTGLSNRDCFFALLTRLCMRAKRFGQMVCLTLVDVDDFHRINEEFGNMAGDLVLTGMGNLLRSIVRDYDLLARFGEDEFAIAMDNSDPQMARQLGQRVRAAVAEHPFFLDDRSIPVTVTVGVVTAPSDMLTERPDALVRLAIEAVNSAHQKGRNQCHFQEMTPPPMFNKLAP